jgi:dihydrofolate reductase
MITMIAAASQNNALGKTTSWFGTCQTILNDSKVITSGHIIMGRKTFESFPNRFNRTHIVISRQEN